MPRRAVQVAVALIEHHGRYLLSRRPHGQHLGGYWEFPGGKRHAGESWQACLRREIREELGVELRVGRRLKPIRFAYPEKSVYLQPFACAIAGGTPRPLQVRAVRWVAPEQLRRLRLPPADQPLVERLAPRRPAVIL